MGYRTYRRIQPNVLTGIGLLLLAIVVVFTEQLLVLHIIQHKPETLLIINGGVILSTGHLLNVQASVKKHHI